MNFFQRYRTIMWVTFGVLFIVSLGMFYLQYTSLWNQEVSLLTDRFQEHAMNLDHQLQSTTEHINTMRIEAEHYLRFNPEHQPTPLFMQIKDDPETGIFSLNSLSDPYSPEVVGNLTGTGSIRNRSLEYYREVDMALELNSALQAAKDNIPNAAWIYYYSKNVFCVAFPWAHSSVLSASDRLFFKEYYQLGIPENNPERKTFWTKAYVDETGQGLMVTCGAPVYHNDEFMGTINLDLTLDFLNSFVTNFEPGYGTVFLINDHNQLIAHPEIVVSADNKVNSARTAFPEAIQDDLAQLFSHRPMQPVEQDSYVFFYQNLHNAPWKLVFVAPESELTLSLLSKMGLGFVVLILGLVIITIITISATRREFITPAELLVKHIRDESNNQATAVPEVPKPWIPWFETISGIFQSNRQLMTELREHNEQLDALVEQRTRELKVKNTELEQSLEQIRSMQEQIITQEKLASLGALTAGIAHEIKNPLNFVNNFAELSVDLVKELREELGSHQDLFDQETQDYIEEILQDLEQNSSKINEHGKRADSIVRGMLLHARGKSGDFQPVDINALMDEYAKLAYHGLRAQDSNFNIDLKTSYDQSIGPVELVPQDISRVFLNIVNNACYATNEKKKTAGDDYHPQVSVVTRNLGDKVEIRIRDNGTGMPPEVVKKIFQPFFTTKPTGQGTGLGLSISFDILNSHQGEMRVETEDGQYTEFIVTLPKKQA